MGAQKCKARGCNRKTNSESGFCFQHWDMINYQPYLCTLDDGTEIVLRKNEIVDYQTKHKNVIFKKIQPYIAPVELLK